MPKQDSQPSPPLDQASLRPPWRVGVDVGGTFTDLVAVDAEGRVSVSKVPSNPADPSAGVISAVAAAAVASGLSTAEFLADCSHFVHGSTVATNIVVEGKGARTALLVTKGFRDSLEIRRGIRPNAWAHRTPFPPVLVPRYLRLPVSGRIDRHGQVIEPLAVDDVDAALGVLREEAVESVAICLFNSFLNGEHERAVAERIRERMPEVWVTLSSEVAPIVGEYERSSTAVISALVAPRVVSYVERLQQNLQRAGLRGPLLIIQSNGGTITAERVRTRPAALLLSGPAAGVGALELCSRALDAADLLSMEIGGTSCDVTLMSGRTTETTSSFQLGGYDVALPSVDIHSIGAGGGTIAAVDGAGLLSVGPKGAGADPGPACYGRGGTLATVTDAQLVLGRLKPGVLAADRKLDIELARKAIDAQIGKPLGISLEAGAAGIIRILEQHLVQAVRKVSAERGRDPRRFVLVAAGGAGPMHGAAVARSLASPAVYVPRLAGAFCALGMILAPVKHEHGRVALGPLDAERLNTLALTVKELEAAALQDLVADGFETSQMTFARELDLRHPGQIGTIRVRIEPTGPISLSAVAASFHREHRRLYGHADPTASIELAWASVTGFGAEASIDLAKAVQHRETAHSVARRPVYFDELGSFVPTEVYRGDDLAAGVHIAGPAIVEETTTCLVVPSDFTCRVDPYGNYVLEPLRKP